MSSSRSEDSYSDTLAQFEEEWANYDQNCLELKALYRRERSHLEENHSDFAENVEKTVDKTFLMLGEAEALLDKAKSPSTLWHVYERINSGRQRKELGILMKKLKENDEKVKEQTDKIRQESKNNTGRGGERRPRQDFRNRKKRISKTIPFTEPYDEDLCDFETID
ncbi:hypothetical protein SNK03_011822 [Fusarium graminearum]